MGMIVVCNFILIHGFGGFAGRFGWVLFFV